MLRYFAYQRITSYGQTDEMGILTGRAWIVCGVVCFRLSYTDKSIPFEC